ncbi:hypothetical protein V1517DRAFT_340570 [Lipomyces orientalis]|uniref:Uncharacterized protein n=1 Tax=Lipomyces orientalis TaxID=1233043 RepID=A0ACC3THJ9_9ASCO
MAYPGEQHRDHDADTNQFHQGRYGSWTDGEVAVLKTMLDRQLGPEYISSRPSPGGGTAYYLEGWKAINLANEVFGFNGWSSEIKSIHEDYVDVKETGKIDVGMSVVVRVTLKDGTFHEDIGFGHVENARNKYMALSKCKKEATTDATKRALRCFGNSVGNCLHDNTYRRHVLRMSVPTGRFDPSNLHRAPEIAAILEQQTRKPNIPRTAEQKVEAVAPSSMVRQEEKSVPRQRQDKTELPMARQNCDPKLSDVRHPTNISALATNDRYISREYDPANRKVSLDEMSFGSDLIEDYNEFDDCMIQSDDFDDFEIAAFDGEFVVRPAVSNGARNHTQQQQSQQYQYQSNPLQHPSNSNGILANSRRHSEEKGDSVTKTPEDLTTGTSAKPHSPTEQSKSSTLHSPAPTALQEADEDNPVGVIQAQAATNQLATPITEKSITFFSARVAEAVQNDEQLDDKALFDVSFQSPSIRKTVDQSVSRPIARSSLSPRVNYDNPRLNTNRMVGMPPSSVANSGRHLLSMGPNCSNSFKRSMTVMNEYEKRNMEPLRESSERVLNSSGNTADSSREDSSKRLKV